MTRRAMVGASGLSEVFHTLILVVVMQASAYVKNLLGLHLDVFLILGVLCNSTTVMINHVHGVLQIVCGKVTWTQTF